MNARTRVRTQPRERVPTRRRRSGYCYSMGLWHPIVTARSAGDNGGSLAIEIIIQDY